MEQEVRELTRKAAERRRCFKQDAKDRCRKVGAYFAPPKIR